jgi:hypothetical protein
MQNACEIASRPWYLLDTTPMTLSVTHPLDGWGGGIVEDVEHVAVEVVEAVEDPAPQVSALSTGWCW